MSDAEQTEGELLRHHKINRKVARAMRHYTRRRNQQFACEVGALDHASKKPRTSDTSGESSSESDMFADRLTAVDTAFIDIVKLQSFDWMQKEFKDHNAATCELIAKQEEENLTRCALECALRVELAKQGTTLTLPEGAELLVHIRQNKAAYEMILQSFK